MISSSQTKASTARGRKSTALPVLPLQKKRNYKRWRAISLSLVYLVFAIHIIHWKITGKTLAPLELNEVMYTLELGIITAGFLFMGLLVAGTAIFGRFFCSWACHIMVLQDFCAYLLRKIGIHAKPIRSRVLLWVPPLTALYMFVWPQVLRMWHSQAFPTFHLASDADGWASFATTNFWRNLPGPWVIAATFAICGFAIVYLMGSRTFCTFVCPYGAVFALADRFAPGRIKVNDACQQCARCTAVCTSGVRVHEEVKLHGMVVNSACMKDLDCVSVCPQNALQYGLAKPAVFSASTRASGSRLLSHFSIAEEILLSAVFLVVLFSFRGLYGQIPFLLSLALGAILGYLAVLTARLVTRPAVSLSKHHLKQTGRLTGLGVGFALFSCLLTILVTHSAFVRLHEYSGLRSWQVWRQTESEDERHGLAETITQRLDVANRWSLIHNPRVTRALLQCSLDLKRFDDAGIYAHQFLQRFPSDSQAQLHLGQALVGLGKKKEAEQYFRALIENGPGSPSGQSGNLATAHYTLASLLVERGEFRNSITSFEKAIKLSPEQGTWLAALGSAYAEIGELDKAVACLQTAIEFDDTLSRAQYNLGTILAIQGKLEPAIESYKDALRNEPNDPEVLNNLGLALLRAGDLNQSQYYLERALALAPENADTHFNLGRLFTMLSDLARANRHFTEAVRINPRYERLLISGQGH